MCACMLSRFSCVQLFVTPCTVTSGSSAHGISQARILEWVAISFSRGSSQPGDRTCISLPLLQWLADSLALAPPDPLQCSCLEGHSLAWRFLPAAVYRVTRVGYDWSDLAAAAVPPGKPREIDIQSLSANTTWWWHSGWFPPFYLNFSILLDFSEQNGYLLWKRQKKKKKKEIYNSTI